MKDNIHSQQVQQIIKAIEITSLSTYKVHGQEEYVQNQMPYQTFAEDFKSFGSNSTVDSQQQRTNLINALTNTIYSKFYCSIKSGDHTSKIPPKADRDEFMNQLSQANASVSGLDYHWKVYNIDTATGNTYIQKNGELRWLQPNGYQFANPQQKQAAVNTFVNLTRQKENRNIQPVFYHAFSNEMFPQEVEIGRFYWNVTPEGASKLINALTTTLNDYKIPFQFKCLNHPELYVRSDSAVLYINKKHVQLVAIILNSIIPNLEPYLVDEIPMFTKQLFKGVSYAEDPGKGQSFGMSRSATIAAALVEAFQQEKNTKQTFDIVVNSLARKGMSLDRLHLNKHTALTPTFPTYE
ncbi:T3SS effector HopA1 family protein [Kordia sp.]|uniref:T3SS effector HopA1 family protein n=1 Tax=Kordia sp. TaxID=1965332 RepID=UPI0025BFFE70|nr:T3SS effector HopA1 family protein [Kordia sp.]MCH2195313.1 T3SS effector HopA1 family protein [Kordia sp.]